MLKALGDPTTFREVAGVTWSEFRKVIYDASYVVARNVTPLNPTEIARARLFRSGARAKLGLPEKILADIVPPGTLLGTLLPHVAEATGLQFAPVYATCGHDTASAVAARRVSCTPYRPAASTYTLVTFLRNSSYTGSPRV